MPTQDLNGGASLTHLGWPDKHHQPTGAQRSRKRLIFCARDILVPLLVGFGVAVPGHRRAQGVWVKLGHPRQPAVNQYVDQLGQWPAARERQLIHRRKPERLSHRHAPDHHRRELPRTVPRALL